MKITLYQDDTLAIDIDSVVKNLNRLTPAFKFNKGKSIFSVDGSFISSPGSYRQISNDIRRESTSADYVLLFTGKRYDNNYFWDSYEKEVIISFAGWEHLTSLPRDNGAVYFICAILMRELEVGVKHEKNTGCINDFWWDKTGVDLGMRSAFICKECLNTGQYAKQKDKIFIQQIQVILNDISTASRANMDICDYWNLKKENETFDVFLCHNSEDKETIRELCARLKQEKITPWFDEEQLPPGRLWQQLLEEQISRIRTAAVFVGSNGIGPWQDIEIRAFLQEFVRRRCPVIPVILDHCDNIPTLPMFLSQLTWVDFRKTQPDPLKQLIWGITGQRP